MEPSRETKKYLIVNADDLGRTTSINEGIERAFRNGIVSSTSLVANSPAFDDALRVIRRNPELGVGVHLTLNEYPPIIESNYLQQLSSGDMQKSFTAVMIARSREIRLIEEEFQSQIEKILSNDIRPSHIDGHNHIHVHPRFPGVLVRLAEEYAISWIRMPAERLIHGKKIKRLIEKIVLTSTCRVVGRRMVGKLRWPDAFHGFTEAGGIRYDQLVHLIDRLQPGINELMCHVGAENDDPPFSIGYRWMDELNTMTAFRKDELEEKFRIRVINYREAEL